jgi:hypothetical protein
MQMIELAWFEIKSTRVVVDSSIAKLIIAAFVIITADHYI